MDILSVIKDKAKKLQRTVVLPEGNEERTILAAKILTEQGITKVVLLGDEKEIGKMAESHGLKSNSFKIINPSAAPDLNEFAELLYERRKAKGLSLEKAKEILSGNSQDGFPGSRDPDQSGVCRADQREAS